MTADRASVPERSRAAGQALECDFAASTGAVVDSDGLLEVQPDFAAALTEATSPVGTPARTSADRS